MTLQHQDCEECRLNIEIISVNGDLISKQILQGMEKSGEQIAVHVNRKGELLSVMTIRTADVPRDSVPRSRVRNQIHRVS